MAVRAAATTAGHQLGDTWDFVPVGSAGAGGGTGSSVDCLGGLGTGNGANALYGYGIVRPADVIVAGGSTTTYGTAVTLDVDRSSRSAASSSSRLTTRIYPPMADYIIGGGGGGGGSSSLYGRLPCGCCETYSSSGCTGTTDASTGSATSASASPSDNRRAATISTFGGGRRQSRRLLVAATGSRGSTDDDAETDDSPRRRRNTADGSSSGSKLLLLDSDVTAATASSQQQQQSISEAYEHPAGSITSNSALATKSVLGGGEFAAEERLRTEFIDRGNSGDGNGNNELNSSPMRGNSVAVGAPSGYMVPELLSDCTPHGGSLSHYDGSTI